MEDYDGIWSPIVTDALRKKSREGPVFGLVTEGSTGSHGFSFFEHSEPRREYMEQEGNVLLDTGKPLPVELEISETDPELRLLEIMQKLCVPFEVLDKTAFLNFQDEKGVFSYFQDEKEESKSVFDAPRKLFELMRWGRREEIVSLLNTGCNVDGLLSNFIEYENETLLGIAVGHGNVEAAKVLLEFGADVNRRSSGFTPLMIAAMWKHYQPNPNPDNLFLMLRVGHWKRLLSTIFVSVRMAIYRT